MRNLAFRLIAALAALLPAAASFAYDIAAEPAPLRYADPMVGVRDTLNSNCVAGPRLPYSSISPSPQSADGGMDGFDPRQPIIGFGQMHVSGTGWGTYGHFLVAPQTGPLSTDPRAYESEYDNLVARPHYMSADLLRHGLRTEIAPAHYSAIYRISRLDDSDADLCVLLDAAQSIATDIVPGMGGWVLGTEAEIDPATGRFTMMVEYWGGWASGVYRAYCAGQFSLTPVSAGAWMGDSIMPGCIAISQAIDDERMPHAGLFCSFGDAPQVMLKVAVSLTGCERAQQLLALEIPGWDFDAVRSRAIDAWQQKLSAFEVDTPSDLDKTIFYSGLYRAFTFASDRSLDCPYPTDMPYWDDNYAFWDTYRTLFPLLTLVDEPAVRDNILALIDRFERNGYVYDGFIAGRDRKGDQGGNNVDCILADAMAKGVGGIPWHRAYAIAKHNADSCRIGYHTRNTRGTDYLQYRLQGWIPASPMSASQTLEFAYNDFCAASMAEALGLADDAEKYSSRSHGWQCLWNPRLEDESGIRGFIDGRRADGSFAFFPPRQYGGSWEEVFYEATSWTYSCFAPHDMDALIELCGGPEAFADRLSYGFDNGLISLSNEPGFLAPWGFAHAGRPDLASLWTRRVMDSAFTADGYNDNEDTGSMGSWFAFSALGLFPNAGQDFYYLSAPIFKRSKVRLSSGGILEVIAPDAGPRCTRITACRINGEPWTEPTVPHSLIANGAVIELDLDKPEQ